MKNLKVYEVFFEARATLCVKVAAHSKDQATDLGYEVAAATDGFDGMAGTSGTPDTRSGVPRALETQSISASISYCTVEEALRRSPPPPKIKARIRL